MAMAWMFGSEIWFRMLKKLSRTNGVTSPEQTTAPGSTRNTGLPKQKA